MKRDQFEKMLSKASRSVQALNRDIAKEFPRLSNRVEFTVLDSSAPPYSSQALERSMKKEKNRIRQSNKPLLNKLETEWFEELRQRYGTNFIRAQSQKFKLANGCWFCPDFTVIAELLGGIAKEIAFEVKGKHAWEDSLVKLKVAAHQWPEIEWRLVWKDGGQWREQRVLA